METNQNQGTSTDGDVPETNQGGTPPVVVGEGTPSQDDPNSGTPSQDDPSQSSPNAGAGSPPANPQTPAASAKPAAAKKPATPAPAVQTKTATTQSIVMEQAPQALTYDEAEEVVIQVGPRIKVVDGEVETLEEAREQIGTKAWFESLRRSEKGKTVQFPSKLLGYPVYNTVKDSRFPGGKRQDYTVVKFADADKLTPMYFLKLQKESEVDE